MKKWIETTLMLEELQRRCCWCLTVQLIEKQRAWELLWEWELSPVPALLGSSVAGMRKWPRTLLRLMWSETVLGSNLKRRGKGLRLYVEWRAGDHDDQWRFLSPLHCARFISRYHFQSRCNWNYKSLSVAKKPNKGDWSSLPLFKTKYLSPLNSAPKGWSD